MVNIVRAEGEYTERTILHYKQNDTESRLEVKQLQVADEAVYKCEITYVEVKEGCSVVQFINLTALIKPQFVKITKDGSTELQTTSTIGPFTEGDEFTLTCVSGGGKPIPSVVWWNGTNKMTGEYSKENGPNGVGTGRNRVKVKLGRGDLGAKYECRAMNDALETPMLAWINVDVHVRPLSLDLSGVVHHVVQGTTVTLECAVLGARPAANLTWYNGSEPILENALRTDVGLQSIFSSTPSGCHRFRHVAVTTNVCEQRVDGRTGVFPEEGPVMLRNWMEPTLETYFQLPDMLSDERVYFLFREGIHYRKIRYRDAHLHTSFSFFKETNDKKQVSSYSFTCCGRPVSIVLRSFSQRL